ncbi:dolichyl-diphosphooligosaccharide--protein glycosyltransferase subunit Ost4p [Monosporozyma servazzii]
MITESDLNSIVIISGLSMMTLIIIYHAISSTFEQKTK